MNWIYPIGLPIALSLTGYNAFLTGLIVLLKRKDKAGIHYFISSTTIFLWGVGSSFQLNNQLPVEVAENWARFSQVTALFIGITWFHFVLVYTDFINKYKKMLYLFYAVTFFLFPFTFTRHYVSGFKTMVGIDHYPMPGLAYHIHVASFMFLVCFSFFIFYQAICTEPASEKKTDFKLVCFSSLYGFVMGSLSFLPVFGIPLPQYNLLLLPLWQILLAYAMIRHRAFDLIEIAEAAQKDKLAAIGTLAASINHEIRNPLYIIRGLAGSFIANLQDGIYSNSQQAVDKAREMMTKVEEHSARAMDIMKRFAMFAKQGGEPAPVACVSLNEVLEGVFPLISHEVQLEKINLIREIPESLSKISIDPRQGEEILFNLIINAFQSFKNQSSRTGTPEIKISAHQQNGSVFVEVQDNGPGIPKDRLKKLFEPFYTTRKEGTGLGLYITKQLVEKNLGEISVQSRLGEGTRFRLKLKRG